MDDQCMHAPVKGQVGSLVQVMLASLHGELSANEISLLQEVQALGQAIKAARAEIAAVRPDDLASHIPSATDELDAIVAHTGSATDAILEVCEALDGIAAAADPATAVRLSEAVTRIYEACSFQDITGQRISKVVAVLKAIDAQVARILVAFDRPPGGARPILPVIAGGPQLPGRAMRQSDIDALLASFD